jgi:hypothetical protein
VFDTIAATIVPLACTFKLTSTKLGDIDPDKTNVAITSSAGEQIIRRDDSAPCHGGANGWQFTDSSHDTIVLCGEACARAKSLSLGKVNVTVGCDTRVKWRREA